MGNPTDKYRWWFTADYAKEGTVDVTVTSDFKVTLEKGDDMELLSLRGYACNKVGCESRSLKLISKQSAHCTVYSVSCVVCDGVRYGWVTSAMMYSVLLNNLGVPVNDIPNEIQPISKEESLKVCYEASKGETNMNVQNVKQNFELCKVVGLVYYGDKTFIECKDGRYIKGQAGTNHNVSGEPCYDRPVNLEFNGDYLRELFDETRKVWVRK